MEYKSGLVSIMVPCFNGGLFLDRFFETILSQSYRNIEIIFVDDGSEDNSKQKVDEYSDVLKSAGIIFKYIKKENGGQASAINAALPIVTGEYVMWFDVDDLMSNDHIEKKVEWLKSHLDYDGVMCKGRIFDENSLDVPIGELGAMPVVGTLFEDILLERRNCSDGLFMFRSLAFFNALGVPHINEKNRSQNMQLLLPICLVGKVGYLNDYLFYYVSRDLSYSHSFKTGKEWIERINRIYEIRLDLLNNTTLQLLNK